jgi:hypothetical protein
MTQQSQRGPTFVQTRYQPPVLTHRQVYGGHSRYGRAGTPLRAAESLPLTVSGRRLGCEHRHGSKAFLFGTGESDADTTGHALEVCQGNGVSRAEIAN